MHQILLSQKAENFLKKLSARKKAKAIAGILSLAEYPLQGRKLSGRLEGISSFYTPYFKIIFEVKEHSDPIVYVIDLKEVGFFC